MKGNERAAILSEAFMMKVVLDLLPADLPHMREMKIQNKKLLLMFDRPNTWGAFGADAMRLLSGGSTKKFNREQGKLDREIGEQRRKIRKLSDLFFKEMLRSNKPTTNQEYREWRRKFDTGMSQNVKKLMQQTYSTLKPLEKLV